MLLHIFSFNPFLPGKLRPRIFFCKSRDFLKYILVRVGLKETNNMF